jgi:hypothetical protein
MAEEYLKGLGSVKSEEDLCRLVCTTMGLFRDDRDHPPNHVIYGKYHEFQSDGGVWQDPGQFSKFLWETRHLFKNVDTFLEIGTFRGWTFFAMVSFWKKFSNPNMNALTINIYEELDHRLHGYVGRVGSVGVHKICTSSDLRGEAFDAVFIDGEHTYAALQQDFENVGKRAKIVIFHDINDRYCHGVRQWWEDHKNMPGWSCLEFTEASGGDVFGIGVLVSLQI